MIRIFIFLVIAAALASPVLAQSLDPVDTSDDRAFDQVDNDNRNVVVDGEGVATSTPINNYGARADRDGAAANNGSSAFVDNSVFAKDSALSRTDLKGKSPAMRCTWRTANSSVSTGSTMTLSRMPGESLRFPRTAARTA